MNAQSFHAHMVSGFDPMHADMVLQPQQTPLHLAPVGAKAVDLDCDGGQWSSNAGVVLRKDIDDHLGFTHDLAAVLSDPRDARRVQFTLHDLLKQRVFHKVSTRKSPPICRSSTRFASGPAIWHSKALHTLPSWWTAASLTSVPAIDGPHEAPAK